MARVLLAMVLAGALIAAPASADTTRPEPPHAMTHIGAAAGFVGDPQDARLAALPTRAELRSGAGMAAAVERAIRLWGQRTLEDPPDEPLHGTVSEALPGGDVDADGRDDMGIVEFDVQSHKRASVRAISGRDGAELWHLPLGRMATAGFVRDDLDGDGADDVVLFEVTRYDVLEQDCSDHEWTCERFLAEFTWVVTAASGRDLAPLWTRSFSGKVEESDTRRTAKPLERAQYRLEVQGGWVVPWVTARAGAPAVLLDRVDLSDRVTEADGDVPLLTFTRSATMRSTHHLSVVGADGGELGSTQVGPAPGFAFVDIAGDGDGDGSDEVLVEEFIRRDASYTCTDLVVAEDCTGEQRTYAHAATLLDGATLQQRWRHVVDEWHGWAYPLDADVDGDGTDDVVHRWVDYGPTAATDEPWVAILSGADGRRLWQTTDVGGYGAIGDVDGDGRDDLVRRQFQWVEDGPNRVVLTRLVGATGATLFATTHLSRNTDDYDEFVWVGIGEDVDRDGVADLIVGRHRVPCRDGLCYEDETESRALVEAGRTGQARWSVGGVTGRYEMLIPIGDVDGDGVPDFDWTHPARDAGEAEFQVDVRSGADGTVVWQRPVTADYAFLAPLGDLDGIAGEDLALVTDHRDGARIYSTVTAVRGHDGSPFWRV